jgi:hypothetical protein
MACPECSRLTKLFEAAVLANSKIRTIIASHKIDAARERFSDHYAIHKKAKTAKAFSTAI